MFFDDDDDDDDDDLARKEYCRFIVGKKNDACPAFLRLDWIGLDDLDGWIDISDCRMRSGKQGSRRYCTTLLHSMRRQVRHT